MTQGFSRVLEALQTASGMLTVADVAAQVRWHSNTTRFHLDGLVEPGLAQRTTEDRDVPGRSRALYSAVPDRERAGRRSYRLLAQILASYLAAHTRQPERAALAAGEEWGRFMTERPARFQRVDAADATRQLTDALEDIGFAPEAVTAGRRREILLRHCPFGADRAGLAAANSSALRPSRALMVRQRAFVGRESHASQHRQARAHQPCPAGAVPVTSCARCTATTIISAVLTVTRAWPACSTRAPCARSISSSGPRMPGRNKAGWFANARTNTSAITTTASPVPIRAASSAFSFCSGRGCGGQSACLAWFENDHRGLP